MATPAHDQEAWLAANTGYCKLLHAKMRPEQCERMRSLLDGGYDGQTRPPQCKDCLGLEKIEEGQEMPKKKATCTGCGREDMNIATSEGLCGRCYQRKRLGKPLCDPEDTGAPAVDVAEEPDVGPSEDAEDRPEGISVGLAPALVEEMKEDGLIPCKPGPITIGGEEFEPYTQGQRAMPDPLVSISKDGTFVFNAGASSQFDLKQYEACEILRGKAGNIALRFLRNAAESPAWARKVTQRNGNNKRTRSPHFQITARVFLREIGWDFPSKYLMAATDIQDVFLVRERGEV